MSDDREIRFLGDLHLIKPNPGDVFVLTSDMGLSMHGRARIMETWRAVMPHHPLILLEPGMKLEVVSQDPLVIDPACLG